MFNIVLVYPQIHTNTGSIGRMCVNANLSLHLIKPLGFEITDSKLKRAGLDYWKNLDLKIWENLDEFLEENGNKNLFLATTKTNTLYYDMKFQSGDFLLFGSEGGGLPENLLRRYRQNLMTIPMGNNGRSLNLATSVGIISYEAIRQNLNKFDFRSQVCEV